MEAPAKRLNRENFELALASHAAANYRKTDKGYECKHCGATVEQTTLVVSIHSAEFGDLCAGPGKVARYPLPYCPKCEGAPKNTSTCVHVPFSTEEISLPTEMIVM